MRAARAGASAATAAPAPAAHADASVDSMFADEPVRESAPADDIFGENLVGSAPPASAAPQHEQPHLMQSTAALAKSGKARLTNLLRRRNK